MTPLAAEYKRILEEHGWKHLGDCKICGGRADHYVFGDPIKLKAAGEPVYQFEIKVRKDRDRWTFYNRGSSSAPMSIKSLITVIEKNGATNKQPA